ncbi:MAG: hypothetical protein U1E60_20750 [Reyranellaceae bacterium]
MIDDSLAGIVVLSESGAQYWGKILDGSRIETCVIHGPQPEDKRFDLSCSTWVRNNP